MVQLSFSFENPVAAFVERRLAAPAPAQKKRWPGLTEAWKVYRADGGSLTLGNFRRSIEALGIPICRTERSNAAIGRTLTVIQGGRGKGGDGA